MRSSRKLYRMKKDGQTGGLGYAKLKDHSEGGYRECSLMEATENRASLKTKWSTGLIVANGNK